MRVRLLILGLCLGALAAGATLERLTLEEMAARSTAIIRGRALSSSAAFVGSTIYTRTRFQVLERWKGPEASEVEVYAPGGTVGPLTQRYSGVPRFQSGQELVLFLWTGRSGRTQVIGFTQGVFEVSRSSSGEAEVIRAPSGETLISPDTGAPVADEPVVMPLRQLVARIRMAAARSGQR
jgi:hypothetical protein